MDAAIRLRAALDEVRAAMEDEGADRRALEGRARLLEGMLREMRELRPAQGRDIHRRVLAGPAPG